MSEKKIDVGDVFPDLDTPTVYVNSASSFCVLHYFDAGVNDDGLLNPLRRVEKTIKIRTDRMLNMLEQIRRA